MNEHELKTLLAMQAGQTVLLAALIQTHPDAAQLQLATVSLLEIFLNGAAGRTLSAKQQEEARAYVEDLLRIQPQNYADPTKAHLPG